MSSSSSIIDSDSPSPSVARRQPLLTSANDGGRRGSRMGETAGECAAVCCCFPLAMMHLLILAVYRLPRGIWRRRKKKKRRNLLRSKKKKKRMNSFGDKEINGRIDSLGFEEEEEEIGGNGNGNGNDVVDWDNEMWDRFYGAGFWRSVSKRKDDHDDGDDDE